jgi:hypothetical protein
LNTIFLDVPVAIIIVILLIIAAYYGKNIFVLSSHAISTFAAQFPLGVNLSVAKVLPFFLISAGLQRGVSGLKPYIPFLMYALLTTLLCSMLWNIPPETSFFYGKGRVYVQIFNLFMLALVTRGTAIALRTKYTVKSLWYFMTIAIVIHGISSLYQMIASNMGLPLIGISRPFNQDIEYYDNIAAFVTGYNTVIIRPGGLVGEPKAAAICYGIFILSYIFGGNKIHIKWLSINITTLGLILSIHGFIAAFSTSAIIALIPAIVINILLIGNKQHLKAINYTLIALIMGLTLWIYLTDINNFSDLADIFYDRSAARFTDAELDAPLAASIEAIIENPLIAIFGYGMGGSSFLTMEYLHTTFEYSYAPNVGIILFLIEYGIVGTILFFAPLIFALIQAARNIRKTKNLEISLLISISVSTCLFSLTGSGLPFGYPLIVATAISALHLSKKSNIKS